MVLSPIEQFFHEAAFNDDPKKLKEVLNSKDNNRQQTPLHKASERGNLKMVKALIILGAKIEAKDEDGRTPLHTAAKVEIAKHLIEKGAQVEARDFDGHTPLMWQCLDENSDVVKYLIEIGAQIHAEDIFGKTPLHYLGTVEIAKCLIENGAKIEAKDNYGFTPLHFAGGLNGTFDALKYLIELGAQIGAKDQDGNTPLHIAACDYEDEIDLEKLKPIIDLLIENGAQIDVKNNDNLTPFELADQSEHFETAQYLLVKKKELELKNSQNNMINEDCVICLTPKIGIFALYPCGHALLCEPCWYKLKCEKYSKCPSCRKPIKDYTKIFF